MQAVVKVASLQIHEGTKTEALESLAKKIDKVSSIPFWTKDKSFVFEITWDNAAPNYSALLTVYFKYDDSDIATRHCEVCEQVHRTFYMAKKVDCTHCEFAAFRKRAESRNREMRSSGKEILRKKG